MALPSCAVIKFTPKLKDADVQDAVRVMNRQIVEDFMPIWGYGRTLRFIAASFDPADDDTLKEEKVSADSVVYLLDESTLPGALGYHDLNTRDYPVGFVFVLDPNDWTTTFSHEVLELILDPTVNILIPGPHPHDPQNMVLHAYEACDAVERMSYQIDGIAVSNFLTNSYFTVGEQIGSRNDFLGVGVTSFGVTKGSHIAFFNLKTNKWEQVIGQHSSPVKAAAKRAEQHEHSKPQRNESKLASILADYKTNYKKRKAAPALSGLPKLRGVTRMSRYEVLAEKMEAQAKVGR
jgi:hypothetical protein